MTTHKSDAVQSGIMPDGRMAGVVLSRSCKFVAPDDSIVSGDTLQMLPIPDNAEIVGLQLYYGALPAGTTGSDIGYGGDPDAFMAGVDMTAANVKMWPTGIADNAFRNTAGFLYTFTADDTIDIAFTKLATKLPTSSSIKMLVQYRMIGMLGDES